MRTMSRTAGTKGGIRPAGRASSLHEVPGDGARPEQPRARCEPTAPGPISLTIVGCDPYTSAHRSMSAAHWSGALMCWADHALAPESAQPCAYSTRRSNMRDEVRTRSTGVISFSTVRIGFTRSVEPIHALAAPMRPPRLRNSSVSIANQSRSSLRASATCLATSFALAPSRAAFAAASTMKPSPPAAVVESTTSMRSPPLPSRLSASLA